jgi:integrase
MSEKTVNAASRALGFPADEVTRHGFRATAKTMLAERLDVAEVIVEAQLAHIQVRLATANHRQLSESDIENRQTRKS